MTGSALVLDAACFVDPGEPAPTRPVDLDVAPGELVAVLGTDAATVLRGVAGEARVVGGSGSVLGHGLHAARRRLLRPGRQRRAARAGVQLVPAQRCLFDTLTVSEHLRLAGRTRRDGPDAAWLLAHFQELQGREDRRAGVLSGGEQQVLALARAAASRPRLLLVEELGRGLAPRTVERVLAVLEELAQRWGTAVVVSDRRHPAMRRLTRVVELGGEVSR